MQNEKHFKLSDERQALAAQYHKLAYWVLNRYFSNINPAFKESAEYYALKGLCVAADRWDSERGVKFTTYATKVIWSKVKRYLRDGNIKKKEKIYMTFPDFNLKEISDSRDYVTPSENRMDSGKIKQSLHKAIDALDDIEKHVIQEYVINEQSLAVVGKQLGVCRETVRTIKRKALEKLFDTVDLQEV